MKLQKCNSACYKFRKKLENPKTDVLRLTKSIIIKKAINNNYIKELIKYKLNKTISEGKNNSLTYHSKRHFDKIIEETKNNFENIDNDSSLLNEVSFNKLNIKNFGTQNKFYLLRKNVNNKPMNSQINIKKKHHKKDIYLKIKKKISEYQNRNERKIISQNKSDNNNENIYDSIFVDFFYKWNNNNINNKNFKSIINKKYSNLIYNEKEIFHYDYSKYITNKINEYKIEKIQNLQDKMHTYFTDINNKEIKITLYGMKLIFIPQNKNNKRIILYLPFTYSLLLYYKGINYFSKILLSIIKFNGEDYNEISINYDGANNFINNFDNSNNKKNINSLNFLKQISRKNNKSNSVIKKQMGLFFMKKVKFKKENKDKKEYIPIFSKDYKEAKDKEKTQLNFREVSKEKNVNKKGILQYSNNLSQNENNFYYFIWETPKISYKLVLEMPKIIFNYQDMENSIITFCHKNIILFLLKRNFINWDFYIMNYLFSIKEFREKLLNNYAYTSRINILRKEKTKKYNNISSYTNEFTKKKRIYEYNKIDKTNNKIYFYLEENINDIYEHEFNSKSDIYYFFYTSNSNINFLIYLRSYEILIDYDKLNPNVFWKYILNFKQMKFLNEIKKYEPLETFLLKIIKTNFEEGSISLDLTVFDDFNPKIINYEKKEIIIPYHIKHKEINVWKSFRRKKTDLILNIQKPYIKIDFDGNKNNNNNEKNELSDELLKKIDEKKISEWARLIIDYIENNNLIGNIKKMNSPLIQKESFKKRIKRGCTTVLNNNLDQVEILNKYINNSKE